MDNFAYIQTGKGVTLFFGAKPVSVDQTHLHYNEILTELKKGPTADAELLLELSDIPAALKGKFFGDVVITDDNEIYYKSKKVHNTLTAKMLQMIKEGWDITIWANFLNNVMKNPSETAVNELYLFLEAAQMPLTPDGHFLAFKKVREDYTSIHDSKTDNSIGSKPAMPRETVDPDRHSTCSRGLHFCAHSYLSSFSSVENHRVLILKINPADVVAIPSDYNNAKGRAWTYEVLGEIDNPLAGPRDKRFNVAVDTSWDSQEDEVTETLSEGLETEFLTSEEDVAKIQEAMNDTSPGIPHEVVMKEIRDLLASKSSENDDEELLFGDIYTAKEILAKVKEVGSVRGAGRALGIAKSTFGDWVRKAKEIEIE